MAKDCYDTMGVYMDQKGQILLIVVLVMVVTLTVGLSVVARTITSVRSSSEEDNSQRAFSAAEAGIEKSLVSNLASSGGFSNNASFSTAVNQLSGTNFIMNNGTDILKDSSSDVWLSTYPGYTNPWSGNLTFYWGASTDTCSTAELSNTMAALEVVLISGTQSAPVMTHYVWDPCQARTGSNSFSAITPSNGTVMGKAFAYHVSILVNSGLIARVVALYAPTKVAVEACDAVHANCSTLPSQGTVITSVGTSGAATRKIVSFKSNPSLPTELFPFILFSTK